MPNDCYNSITIICNDAKELNKLIKNELINEEDIYYGSISIQKKWDKAIKFENLTAWKPDYKWLESLVKKYPNCLVKNDWIEEGGIAGLWVGSVKNGIKSIYYRYLSLEEKDDIFGTPYEQ
jgi:hypothetical protein